MKERKEDAAKEEAKGEEPRGIRCRACGCPHVPVLYTRQRRGYVVRVRECRHCGTRMRTREK